MTKRHPENERIKHRYFQYLKQVDGKSESTIRLIEKSLLRFEEFTGFADLKEFDQRKAIGFKEAMAKKELAPATILSTINNLKRFLAWLSTQPGYKSRIKVMNIDYLNLPEKDIRAANAPADKPHPSLAMVEKVIAQMPHEKPLEKRNRALVAFTAITGIRDGALISLKVKHFDASRMLILQNPREVATKFSKRIDTYLLPLNDSFELIVLEWLKYLRQDLLYAPHDPLFPKTALGHDENDCFIPTGLSREHWANASPVRSIFKAAFKAAQLPAFMPHSFRRMIISEAYNRNLSHAGLKAWSQNLGHESLLTTLTSYGKIDLMEQGRLVRQSRFQNKDDLVEEIRKLISESDKGKIDDD